MDAGRTAIGVCFAVVALSALWDLASRNIPNTLSLGGLAIGVALQVSLGFTEGGVAGALHRVGWALAGIALCGALPLLSYIRGELGGGDLKLFLAIGALCGPVLGFNAQAWTYVVVMLAALPIRALRRGVLGAMVRQFATGFANLFRPRERRVVVTPVSLPSIVMGPSIFAGLCIAFAYHGVFR